MQEARQGPDRHEDGSYWNGRAHIRLGYQSLRFQVSEGEPTEPRAASPAGDRGGRAISTDPLLSGGFRSKRPWPIRRSAAFVEAACNNPRGAADSTRCQCTLEQRTQRRFCCLYDARRRLSVAPAGPREYGRATARWPQYRSCGGNRGLAKIDRRRRLQLQRENPDS